MLQGIENAKFIEKMRINFSSINSSDCQLKMLKLKNGTWNEEWWLLELLKCQKPYQFIKYYIEIELKMHEFDNFISNFQVI